MNQLPTIIILKNFDEGINEFTGSWDEDTISYFLINNCINDVMLFDVNAAEEIFAKQNPTLFLIYGGGEKN